MTQPSPISTRRRHPLARLLHGESRGVLLGGVALNWVGAAKLIHDVWWTEPRAHNPSDYHQMKAFTAGTAATFGALYLYIYTREKEPTPLLIFGASLKTWAFVLSAILRAQGRLDRTSFVTFGVSNGLVGGLFWAHIAQAARHSDRPNSQTP
jgi:hypothetical protein